MSSPTPNGPTINDLQYASFATPIPLGFNPMVLDGTTTIENVTMNLVGYTATDAESDTVNTAEKVTVAPDSFGPNQFSLTVSDSTMTSENLIYYADPTPLAVSDSEPTSEKVDIIRNSSRDIAVSDATVTSENTTEVRSG